MKEYIVLYRDSYISVLESPLCFLCVADDVDHAEEQTINAYPDACIVWVYQCKENDTAEADALIDYYNSGVK